MPIFRTSDKIDIYYQVHSNSPPGCSVDPPELQTKNPHLYERPSLGKIVHYCVSCSNPPGSRGPSETNWSPASGLLSGLQTSCAPQPPPLEPVSEEKSTVRMALFDPLPPDPPQTKHPSLGKIAATQQQNSQRFLSLNHQPTQAVHRVVMIMGFQCNHAAWKPQVDGLLNTALPITMLILDNRGCGLSTKTGHLGCSTDRMAQDVIELTDYLGWDKFNVVGHSMGGMISMKLCAKIPRRILSLTLISTCAGGFSDLIPPWKFALLLPKYFAAKKNIDKKIEFDLLCHYSTQYLHELVNGVPRWKVLKEMYSWSFKRDPSPTEHGERAHFRSVFTHGLTKHEKMVLTSIPVHVLHGRQDVIIKASAGQKLCHMLRSPLYTIDGGHMLQLERADELNAYLTHVFLQHAHEEVLTLRPSRAVMSLQQGLQNAGSGSSNQFLINGFYLASNSIG